MQYQYCMFIHYALHVLSLSNIYPRLMLFLVYVLIFGVLFDFMIPA
jgi:hypothetical protein